ncbi:hypothetical protein PR202_gb16794 [Eleusine coracana subsp. coracana]|uniref:Uncharacterized protein n=1 Tax=Eleusine coracana subsp. coracana TaxID=191504 RepID=A0AAV5F1B8_ELECO|nr:hypothetical protein PR202_gb16737 [Eleusine coracana subsp. coracana]GJN28646.1 hypothetical protein PR202_gb16794 [Eleusine coracana subsp. coracana]
MIRRKCLIRRWIAEGYLGDMNAEKNGEVYFADFINKSIIQPSPPVDIGGVATIRYCRVHSLLGEISLAQSMEEKFCFVLGSRSSSSQTCDDNVRHLSISSSWRRDANDLKAVGDISHVRSLTVCGKWEPALKLLENMRMLRVLDLAGTGELLWDHHIEPHLDKLIHLKYLSLRGCRNIFWLTHSLGNLRDLETLDVRGTSMIILPKTIVNLEKLQYIRAGQIPKDEQPTDCMGSAEPKTNTRLTLGGVTKGVIKNSFRSEPKDSGEASKRDTFNKTFFCDGHLLNSRRDKHGIEVPKGTGKLSSLETLGVIDVGARKNTSTELVILTKLRKLGVTGLKRENSQQFFSAIAMLTLLQSLSIRSEGKPGLQECLDGKSSSPPTDIRSLKLYGNLITLPPWISSLQNLAKLKLRSTRLGPDAVYVLGRLPCLAILRLLSNSIEGEDLRFNFQHGTFRSLVLLQLDGLPDLQSIEFKQGATPNLELLQVDNCTDIEKHGCSGLSFLPSLKEVWLKAGHRYSKIFMDDLKKQLEGNPNRSDGGNGRDSHGAAAVAQTTATAATTALGATTNVTEQAVIVAAAAAVFASEAAPLAWSTTHAAAAVARAWRTSTTTSNLAVQPRVRRRRLSKESTCVGAIETGWSALQTGRSDGGLDNDGDPRKDDHGNSPRSIATNMDKTNQPRIPNTMAIQHASETAESKGSRVTTACVRAGTRGWPRTWSTPRFTSSRTSEAAQACPSAARGRPRHPCSQPPSCHQSPPSVQPDTRLKAAPMVLQCGKRIGSLAVEEARAELATKKMAASSSRNDQGGELARY